MESEKGVEIGTFETTKEIISCENYGWQYPPSRDDAILYTIFFHFGAPRALLIRYMYPESSSRSALSDSKAQRKTKQTCPCRDIGLQPLKSS